MIKDLLNSLFYGQLATVALMLFFTAFVAVCVKTWLTDKTVTDNQAHSPLSDGKRSSK